MNYIEHNLFPASDDFPAQIQTQRTSIVRSGDAVRHLTQSCTVIGMAHHISSFGDVDFIALANRTNIFYVNFDQKVAQLDNEMTQLLCGGRVKSISRPSDAGHARLVSFGMAHTAVQLQRALHERVSGVDISEVDATQGEPKYDINPFDVVKKHLSSSVDQRELARVWLGDESNAAKNIGLQAWLAACVGYRKLSLLDEYVHVDTGHMNVSELQCIGRLVVQWEITDNMKPREFIGEVTKAGLNKDGKYEIVNNRYKTRVRAGRNTHVVMVRDDGHTVVGKPVSVKGKQTTLSMGKNFRDDGRAIKEIKVIGRQNLTNMERAMQKLIYCVVTGRMNLRESEFIRRIWFPQWKALPSISEGVDEDYVDEITSKMALNKSQRYVVRGMVVLNDLPLMVIHGPPGTGKTTTIAAASRVWDLQGSSTWIVAHSNVAVKNIAETLFKKGVDFILLVSKEFFVEWHEHLYEEIQDKVLRSDELPKERKDMERMVDRKRLILSTLSMMANPALRDIGLLDIVPVERLVIDEASQINISELMPIFQTFQKDLRKVCLFGDPEQLPPFGHDRFQGESRMKTIFDFSFEQNQPDFFLDTQYRMPIPIGDFLSKCVYKGRLKSKHSISDPSCVVFIDVETPRSHEEKAGFSWKNEAEVQTIVHLIENYYKGTNFAVVTPYDGQRAAIENAVKAARLPWNSIYNLDSFQGNEADYLLVSVVRTGNQPGFLTSRKRMNVLLSRCRKATIIVTNRRFMSLGAADTLLGSMLYHWERILKVPNIWISWNLVADGVADLPGALGPNRVKQVAPAPRVISGMAHNPQKGALFGGRGRGGNISYLFARNGNQAWSANRRPDAPSWRNNADNENFPPLLPSRPILQGSWRNLPPPNATTIEQKYSLFSRKASRPAEKGTNSDAAKVSAVQMAKPSESKTWRVPTQRSAHTNIVFYTTNRANIYGRRR